MSHSWPGNVRELRNLIERAVILAGNQVPSADVVRRALGAAASTLSADHEHDLNIRSRVESLERRLIEAALERTGGKRARAAALLGVDPRNLAYYLRKHGMTPEEPEAGEKGEA
jgi:DNA-binding NtrC family response regulator